MRIAVSLLGAVLLLGVAAGPAQARFGAKKSIWGPGIVNGASRFPIYRDLGVGIYQQSVNWADVAPTRPAHPRNPNDRAYHWPADLVQAVSEARRSGMRVSLLLIRSPRWANGGRPSNWAPRESAFADFAYAASRRFPSVHLWMVWGEPSRSFNWKPLRGSPADDGTTLTPAQAAAPRRYARLLDKAYAALKAASRRNVVIGGNTYTTGDITTWRWIRYMRLPNGRPPRLDLYGHNPFSFREPNFRNPPGCCGIADFSDLPRLHRAVDRNLGRRGHRSIPLFLSEFFIPTDVDVELNFHVDPPVQAQWISDALRLVRGHSWLAAFGWIHLYDDPPRSDGGLVSHSGLLYSDGQPKPGYAAFRDG
jgi:glutathione S-transferase